MEEIEGSFLETTQDDFQRLAQQSKAKTLEYNLAVVIQFLSRPENRSEIAELVAQEVIVEGQAVEVFIREQKQVGTKEEEIIGFLKEAIRNYTRQIIIKNALN